MNSTRKQDNMFTNTCCNIWAWTKYYCLKTKFQLAPRLSKNHFVLFGLALLAFACSITNQSARNYPPWDGEVKVYFYTPKEAYEKIGIVSTQGSSKEPISYLIADLQQKAASIGASGIFVQPAKTRTGVIKLTATAIRIN